MYLELRTGSWQDLEIWESSTYCWDKNEITPDRGQREEILEQSPGKSIKVEEMEWGWEAFKAAWRPAEKLET